MSEPTANVRVEDAPAATTEVLTAQGPNDHPPANTPVHGTSASSASQQNRS